MTRIQLQQAVKLVETENKPFVLLPLADYESLLATFEELSDPGSLQALRESEADVKAGRVRSHEEVFAELDAKDKLHAKSRKRPRANRSR